MYALDRNSIRDYIDYPTGIDIQRKDFSIQKISDFIRLGLLEKFGGVWIDATVLCTRPLSEWLEEYYGSKFFAFRDPGKNRTMSSWFIAAESESVILQRFYKHFTNFFVNNYFSNQGSKLGNMYLKLLRRRWESDFKTTLKWHSWFARKVLRVYPYFIFHYTFNKLILDDPECANLWNKAKPLPAGPMHRVQFLELELDGIEKAKREIDFGMIPMHKLNWRIDTSNTYWSTILPYFAQLSS